MPPIIAANPFMPTQSTKTNGAVPTQTAEIETKIWQLSYAFDVPHYADFTIRAETEDQAERIANALLVSGHIQSIFDNHVSACFENASEERIFSTGEGTEEDHEYLNLIDAAAREKVELPDGWINPPEVEEEKTEQPAPRRVYFREKDGTAYYLKNGLLHGAPQLIAGGYDEQAECAVCDFDMPLTDKALAEIANALIVKGGAK